MHSGKGLLRENISEIIVRNFYQVHAELGAGHFEHVYANAMAIALEQAGVRFEREVLINVYFRGQIVGPFRADMVVESVVLLEFKAGHRLDPHWEPQLINYLKNSSLEVGLLLFFGRQALVKRRIFTNDRKLLRREPPSILDDTP
jgi:GxxExxY protein